MEIVSIEHRPRDKRQPLTADQLLAVCERAFGSNARITSARELGGGEFNVTYLIGMGNGEQVILRVAPLPTQALPWHEEHLMRHEHAIQPYLAPLASLLPKTLHVDFTHQVIPRDYLFQTYMPGERWDIAADTLSAAEEDALWRQLAEIARTIHAVQGDAFGHPCPGRQFLTWSGAVCGWLERGIADAERVNLDTTPQRDLLALARVHADLLDEIRQPRLLHGDLWPFNVLITRTGDVPRIVAVLDCDRASWGDPLADWTFHLLPRKASAHVREVFWQTYGTPEQRDSMGARFREKLYEGLHAGNVFSEVRRRGREELVEQVGVSLCEIVAELRATVE